MNKKTVLIMVCTLIIISGLTLCTKIKANNRTNGYKTEIENNDTKISIIKDIQHSLHILAEKVRIEQDNNNGFDELLSQKWHEYENIKESLKTKNLELSAKIEEESKRKYVGDFTITYYCPCVKCNGKYTTTATGTKFQPYKTIAVDPKIIPLGSLVHIQDLTYIAEDTGGGIKGNRIDICVSTHQEALTLGRLDNIPVYIINK